MMFSLFMDSYSDEIENCRKAKIAKENQDERKSEYLLIDDDLRTQAGTTKKSKNFPDTSIA